MKKKGATKKTRRPARKSVRKKVKRGARKSARKKAKRPARKSARKQVKRGARKSARKKAKRPARKSARKKVARRKGGGKRAARKRAAPRRGGSKKGKKKAKPRKQAGRPKPKRTVRSKRKLYRRRQSTVTGARGKRGRHSYTVNLVDPTGPDSTPSLSAARRDRIRWWNQDSIDHTLTLTTWVFVEPSGPILVEAGRHTRWFTIAPGTVHRTYSYGIDPAFRDQGPPDPPQFEGGP